MQAPHKHPPGSRYIRIATGQEPPKREALDRLAGGIDPSTPQRHWGFCLHPSEEAKTRSLGRWTSTLGKPSPRTPSPPTSWPSHMSSSNNRAGRYLQGESCGLLVARRKRIAVPRRPRRVSPQLGKALNGQLAQEGEYASLGRVDVDLDAE